MYKNEIKTRSQKVGALTGKVETIGSGPVVGGNVMRFLSGDPKLEKGLTHNFPDPEKGSGLPTHGLGHRCAVSFPELKDFSTAVMFETVMLELETRQKVF